MVALSGGKKGVAGGTGQGGGDESACASRRQRTRRGWAAAACRPAALPAHRCAQSSARSRALERSNFSSRVQGGWAAAGAHSCQQPAARAPHSLIAPPPGTCQSKSLQAQLREPPPACDTARPPSQRRAGSTGLQTIAATSKKHVAPRAGEWSSQLAGLMVATAARLRSAAARWVHPSCCTRSSLPCRPLPIWCSCLFWGCWLPRWLRRRTRRWQRQ